ncbi:MAG: YihY/virulence factor BrkB family protein [Lachnospiraceae bacterium]|nr:YihY/virulence factor BrkB family protein [Lachnospiraceae bacterium]
MTVKNIMKNEKMNKAVAFGKDMGKALSARAVGTYASSIAFYIFLSFIPVVIIVAWVISRFGITAENMTEFFVELVPPIASDLVASIISEAYRNSVGIVPVSLVVLIWSASLAINSLILALNAIYGVEEHRNMIQIFLAAVLYTLVLMAMLILILFLIFGQTLYTLLGLDLPWLLSTMHQYVAIRYLMFFILGTVIFAALYKFLPSGRRAYKKQLPGAAISSFSWMVFQFFFTLYVNGQNKYNMFYGSIGVIAIVLFWLLVCFFILLLGGYINSWLEEKRAENAAKEALDQYEKLVLDSVSAVETGADVPED